METIDFRIIKIDKDMYYIDTKDTRNIYKEMIKGEAMCSMQMLFDKMECITKEVEKLGNKAVFVIKD